MTSLLNMCSNCSKYEVTKTRLCGFNDWCEECDTSLWSTRDVTTTATTTTINDEELDYCEECYKTVRETFLVDVNLQGVYLINDHHRPKGAKWCTQKCLDLYNVKHPIMIYCKECFARMELTKMVRDFCKICS